MERKFIVRLHPDTFYLITYNSPLLGKNRMVANKIYADRVDRQALEILGFSDRVDGDRLDATPKNVRIGNLVIVSTGKGVAYLGKDQKDPSTFRIKHVFRED